VRHVRMLGLCLVALFAVGALTSGSALAAKDPYSVNTWSQYKYCPLKNAEFRAGKGPYCFVGRTSGGSKGGFFTLGEVTVKLNQPITLQGGFISSSTAEKNAIKTEQIECEANPEYSPECKVAQEAPEGFANYWYYKAGALKVFPTEGGETLEAPELKVSGGLGLISKGIQERQEWPEALKAAFKEAKKNKESTLYVKIELAGTSLFEHFGGLSTERILLEEGPAFVLPLKVRMINPWLEKLGGGPCLVGNDENPIMQNLSTAPPGRAALSGGASFNEAFTQVGFTGSRLTDLNWPVPVGADASGCGGEYESYVDGAINEVLELPHQHGITVLQGDLFTGNAKAVEKAQEEGLE
jgi:hypothetical protein